jgi:hypothetical protein
MKGSGEPRFAHRQTVNASALNSITSECTQADSAAGTSGVLVPQNTHLTPLFIPIAPHQFGRASAIRPISL